MSTEARSPATKDSSPRCRGSRPRRSRVRSGWPSTRASRTTTRLRRPEDMDVERLRDEDRFRFANELGAFITVDATGDRRLRLPGWGPHGLDAGQPGRRQAPLPGRAAPRHPARARARRGLGPIRPDLWRAHRDARPTAGAAAPVRPVAGPAGVDDALADPPRRRAGRARTHRCEPVPPALGLRRRQRPVAQVGAHRLQGLVPQVVRQAQSRGATRTPRRWWPPWRRRSRRRYRPR